MHKGHYSPQTLQIMELSKGPTGVTADDLPDGLNPRVLWRMANDKQVFTIKSGSRLFKRHYFDTQERADAYYEASPQPKKKLRPKAPPKPLLLVSHSSKRPSNAGGPARMEGEPIITAETKITIAPPPADRIWHTNTHKRFG